MLCTCAKWIIDRDMKNMIHDIVLHTSRIYLITFSASEDQLSYFSLVCDWFNQGGWGRQGGTGWRIQGGPVRIPYNSIYIKLCNKITLGPHYRPGNIKIVTHEITNKRSQIGWPVVPSSAQAHSLIYLSVGEGARGKWLVPNLASA